MYFVRFNEKEKHYLKDKGIRLPRPGYYDDGVQEIWAELDEAIGTAYDKAAAGKELTPEDEIVLGISKKFSQYRELNNPMVYGNEEGSAIPSAPEDWVVVENESEETEQIPLG